MRTLASLPRQQLFPEVEPRELVINSKFTRKNTKRLKVYIMSNITYLILLSFFRCHKWDNFITMPRKMLNDAAKSYIVLSETFTFQRTFYGLQNRSFNIKVKYKKVLQMCAFSLTWNLPYTAFIDTNRKYSIFSNKFLN